MSTRQEQIDRIIASRAVAQGAAATPTGAMVAPPTSIPTTPTAVAAQTADKIGSGAGAAADYIAQSIKDAPGALTRGVAGAINQTAKAGQEMSKWLNDHMPLAGMDGLSLNKGAAKKTVEGFADLHRNLPLAKAPIPDSILPAPPQNFIGKSIENVTQFAIGMVGAGKITGAIGLPAEASGLAGIGLSALKGGIATYLTQDPYAKRFSNLLGDNIPALKSFTDYLAAKPEDAPATARLKNSLEGMGLGAATDILVASAKALKLNYLWQDAPAAMKPALVTERQQAINDIEAALNKAGTHQPVQMPDGKWTIQSTQATPVGDAAAQTPYPHIFNTQSEATSEASTLNMLEAEHNQKRAGLLTEEQKAVLVDAAKDHASKTVTENIFPENGNGESSVLSGVARTALKGQIKDLISPDNPWMGQTAGIDFNLKNISSNDGVKSTFEAVSQIMEPDITAARGGAKLTNEQLIQQVQDVFGVSGATRDAIVADLAKTDDLARPNGLAVRLNVGRAIMDQIGGDTMKWSAVLDGDPDNALAFSQVSKSLSDLVRVAEYTKGRMTQSARAVQSMKIPTGQLLDSAFGIPRATVSAAHAAAQPDGDLLARKFLAALPNMTSDQIQGFARKVRMSNGDPATLLKITDLLQNSSDEEVKAPGFWNKLNTVWVNSVLSGPLTLARISMGNTLSLATKPFETYMKGVYAGKPEIQQEGIDLFTGFFSNLHDSLRAAKQSFVVNRPIIDPGNITLEMQNPFQGYLGTAIGVPSRMLMATHDFFKNLSYRSYIRAKALAEARDMGLDAASTIDHVDARIEQSLARGEAVNPNALAFAQNTTFTNPLTPGSFGNSLQKLVNKHPALRFAALPFVKTPTNILLWSFDRTPGISLLAKSNREALMAGGEQAADVMSKWSTGAIAWGAAYYLAANGTITGNGPSNADVRKEWLDADHKPYSIKIGDKWYPYRAADPLLMPFGIVADMVSASGEIPWDTADNAGMAFVTSLSRNLANKSYMYGLTDFMKAAFDGDQVTLKKYVQAHVGSMVPAVLNQVNPDDTMREMRDYTDQIIGHVPGLSATLPPRVNIFGDPVMKAPFTSGRAINPFTPSMSRPDTHVEQKLYEIGKGIQYPDKNYPATNVDMTSKLYGMKGNLTPYDRLMQLIAKGPGNGAPSLRAALGKLVDNPNWDKLSHGVPGIQEGGTQFDKVNGLVQEYRDRANKQILVEFPELRKAVDTSKQTQKVARKGGQAAVDKILGLLHGSQ